MIERHPAWTYTDLDAQPEDRIELELEFARARRWKADLVRAEEADTPERPRL